MADPATVLAGLVGGALGSSVGASLTFFYNRANFNRQARLELVKQRYQEGIALLEFVSSLVDRRFYYLQRLVWASGDGDAARIERIEKEYFQTVSDWNTSLRTCRNKMRLLVGPRFADRFLDYRDDHRGDHPDSLHYHFVLVHRRVRAAQQLPADALLQDAVDQLNWHCSDFLEELTTEFAGRAVGLHLLDVPPVQLLRPRMAVQA